ncbi:MAG: hypothetical protein IIX45_01175 [Lachnospiraceae bacterium]|nr:hypothetical protein [Lachnospiraceae bacterium]
MKKIIKTDKKNTIKRFKEAVASRLMLGEPRMVGFFWGSYVQLQHMFGEKAFCIWDFIIHIEAVGCFKSKKNEDGEDITELNYKIVRGYWNPVTILMWYLIPFIPFFMTVASKSLWNMFPPALLYGLPAIPIGLRVLVTFICSRVCKKADEGIKLLEEEMDYEVARINKYPEFDVKGKFKKIDI